ncbi:MAG: geranylgeranylglyceryl/heptaprenylglyceryl phosphate synthase [Bacteroidota bacterium]|nr:MAG: geranylgeranylglyceryl/heptaprenylglyceryl phosphate synthase [Bacteroidota bacterium]
MQCYNIIASPGKKIALLIDPDKLGLQSIIATVYAANENAVSLILVGGSLMSTHIDKVIQTIKEHTRIPVVLFPGSLLQLSRMADALLLLSLVSGRNPDYLIGNHVQAAPFIRQSALEVIPTAYVLIDGGTVTSVEYVSNTRPIPSNKPELVVATCIAAEMLGHRLIYLEAGSGALNPVPPRVISEVKKIVNIPVIVGGGLNSPEKVAASFESGADMVVIGNVVEKNIENLHKIASVLQNFKN